MPSLFALVSDKERELGPLLGRMIHSLPRMHNPLVRGFVGEEPFLSQLPSLRLPSSPAFVAAAQVGAPFSDQALLVDSPARRPRLLEGGRSFFMSWIEKAAPPTSKKSPLFGAAIGRLDGKLIVGRDRLGTKTLFCSCGTVTGFCSEPAPLRQAGFRRVEAFPPALVQECHPGMTLHLLPTDPFRPERRKIASVGQLIDALTAAIAPLPVPRAVFFSGGIDSLVLAKISEGLGDTVLITAGLEGSKDLSRARSTARSLASPLETVQIPRNGLEKDVDELLKILATGRSMNIAIALPILHAATRAAELGIGSALMGQGADEIFGGYHRYLSDPDPTASMTADLVALHTRGLDACNLAARSRGVDVFLPYLDDNFLQLAASLPLRMKIRDEKRKVILREIGRRIGLHPEHVDARKCAIQYGSGVNKHISRILRRRYREGSNT